MRSARIMLWGANALALLLLIATAALLLLERRWASPVFRDPARAFVEGSIGTEFAPLPVLLALPRLFPERFPPLGATSDWIEAYGFLRGGPAGLPYGLTLSNWRPLNAAPSPVQFVGIGCAACHTGEVQRVDGTSLRVSGMGNQSLDLIAFFEAFRFAILDRGPDGAQRLTVDAIAEGASPSLTFAERAFTWIWLAAARRALTDGTARHDLPWTEPERLRDATFHPVGPGRTNPFNTLVTGMLGLPNTAADAARPNRGFARIPPVWQQQRRDWAQFDGGIRDLNTRSALAALTIGATPENLAHPEIYHNVRAASDYTRTLAPPSFAQVFGMELDAVRAERGAAVYRAYCASCHGMPEAGHGWRAGPRQGEIIPIDEIGTDSERVGMRHALALADRLYAIFAVEFIAKYNMSHPLATSRDSLRPGSADDTRGYIAQPIEGGLLRAPLLHNGAVPSLSALIHLTPRPARFARGRNPLDPVVGGIAAPEEPNNQMYFVFDTRAVGNGAGGHDYPWHPSDTRYDRAALEDLLEYLKGL